MNKLPEEETRNPLKRTAEDYDTFGANTYRLPVIGPDCPAGAPPPPAFWETWEGEPFFAIVKVWSLELVCTDSGQKPLIERRAQCRMGVCFEACARWEEDVVGNCQLHGFIVAVERRSWNFCVVDCGCDSAVGLRC